MGNCRVADIITIGCFIRDQVSKETSSWILLNMWRVGQHDLLVAFHLVVNALFAIVDESFAFW
ncbi:hypothetical protein D3C80_2233590 [compost metagenome]